MSKRKELITTKALVKTILETDIKARNSDNYLYLKVIEHQALQKQIDIDSMGLPYFLNNQAELGFIPFETVRRSRQAIQAAHPELRGNAAVQEYRAENEVIFRDFARGEVGC